MHKTGTLFLIIGLFYVLDGFGQSRDYPFKNGEKLNYRVAYNWEFVWVDAGRIEFEVNSTTYNDNPAWSFKSFGRSLTSYDWIFKVRDYFESVTDSTSMKPYLFKRITSEGGYKVNNRYVFDYQKNCILSSTENSNRSLQYDTLKIDSDILDIQTAVYYFRTLNYPIMTVGEKIPFHMIIDGESFNLYGRYLGIETIENFDGQIFRCHKFSALLVEGTIFTDGEDLFVWITDDKNRIPILVEAKILIGSVKAFFTKGENLQYPMDALIK
nr:DUF3108 domain-containing protein [Bacteroidota bacterium]